MEDESIQQNGTQADFIKKELNFDIDTESPTTEAPLNNDYVEDYTDILGNGKLTKKIVKRGENGTRPVRGDICTIKVTGKLEDGTIVEEHEDLKMQLGDLEVIQGLELAITLMDVGEVAEIQVNPKYAYGQVGKEPSIPSDATILYTVELLATEVETEIETLGVAQRREIGNKKRERGNWWFRRDEPSLASHCYRRALEYLLLTENRVYSHHNEAKEAVSDAELQALMEDRMKVYNNLAAAQMKQQAYYAALESVESVLSCQPKNVKALYRKGKILHYQGEHELAYETLIQAAKLDPESKAIQAVLAILKEKNAKDAQHEKNLYRKMLGTNKNNNTTTKGTKKEVKNTASSKIAWSLIGGATAAIIGVFLYRFAS